MKAHDFGGSVGLFSSFDKPLGLLDIKQHESLRGLDK